MKKMAWLCAGLLALVSIGANAQIRYQEGKDYVALPQTLDEGKAPKVIEFFWFGCPHCYAIEPAVVNWVQNKPEAIEFEKVPAASGSWKTGAQLFYTLKALNLDLNQAVFDEANRNLAIVRNPKAAAEFVAKNSTVTVEEFDKAWNSFGVAQQLKRAEEMFEQSGFEGVPSFMVNGKYGATMTEKPSQLFEKIEFMALHMGEKAAEEPKAEEAKPEEVKTEAAPVAQ
ncbi:MAG: thiol:disulfide interchange protein DsbA/DsbL [Cardiobacteriaceae bacterium]|nr:thiol:disulfide interchange protein DsbA/DsbL [Cardiobacteriaceae bacterium]